MSQVYLDFEAVNSFFNNTARVPNNVGEDCDLATGDDGGIWPGFKYVEGATDTVLHIIAQETREAAGDPQALYYFRRTGGIANLSGVWNNPARCIDTVYNIAQDIDATDGGRVALFWMANVVDPTAPCNDDTCSSTEAVSLVQWENDVYVQISTNYGVSWQPRINITKLPKDSAGYHPYSDLSGLIDGSNRVHCVWNASNFTPPTGADLSSRIFHWDNVSNKISIAVDASYDQDSCAGGAWNLNTGKMSLSQCDGKFYLLFTQFNEPGVTMSDCATQTPVMHRSAMPMAS
jgi:hypothetical protein